MLDVELTKKQNSNSEKNVYCLKKKRLEKTIEMILGP